MQHPSSVVILIFCHCMVLLSEFLSEFLSVSVCVCLISIRALRGRQQVKEASYKIKEVKGDAETTILYATSLHALYCY